MTRARRKLRTALAAIAVLGGSIARADPFETGGEASIRVGSFRPAIDSEFRGGSNPYALAFGSGGMWGGRLEYARTVSGGAGTLGLGVGLGWFGAFGHGLYQDATTGAWTTSRDETALHVVPASLFAMYRLDAVAGHALPLAPYGRVSLEEYLWVTTGTAQASRTGATAGYGFTVGVALLLDVLDPSLARELAQETGVRHTCLTLDATRAVVNDFGSARSWDLSTRGWALSGGLTLTF